MRIILFLLTLSVWGVCQDKKTEYRTLVDAYNQASEKNDISSCRKYLESIDRLRPNSFSVLKALAQTQLSEGDLKAANHTLERAIWVNSGIINDQSFVDLATSTSSLRWLADSISRPNVLSDVVYILQDTVFHPEGIAFDEKRERFIFGSIRTGQLIACEKNGTIDRTFFKAAGRMACIMGMRISADGNLLFVATAYLPQHADFTPEIDGWSAVVVFDLKTGEEVDRVVGPAKHVFGDLAVDNKNTVYISDSGDPVVYKWISGRKSLDTLIALDRAWNLQGITITPDDKYIFVADYIGGVYRVDLQTKATVHLGSDKNGLRGIDGLYFFNGVLMAVQNGVFPRRVLSLKLSSSLDAIDKIEILDNNLPYKGEPTLGYVVNGYLLYIANAPWHAYDKENHFLKSLAEPTVIRSLKIR